MSKDTIGCLSRMPGNYGPGFTYQGNSQSINTNMQTINTSKSPTVVTPSPTKIVMTSLLIQTSVLQATDKSSMTLIPSSTASNTSSSYAHTFCLNWILVISFCLLSSILYLFV